MKLENLNLKIAVDGSGALDYQCAVADGDLARVRAVLLQVCNPSERAAIRRLLPDDLVNAVPVKPVY